MVRCYAGLALSASVKKDRKGCPDVAGYSNNANGMPIPHQPESTWESAIQNKAAVTKFQKEHNLAVISTSSVPPCGAFPPPNELCN